MLYTPQAARELEQAAAWIAEDNPAAAEAFLQSALIAAERLASRPALGRSRPYVPARYRFWPLLRYGYLLVYDASVQPIQVVRVVHMARDLPRLLVGMPD